MKYSPKKTDSVARLLYAGALLGGFVLMFIPAEGLKATLFCALALVLISIGIFIFIKYDCTRYEYILLERNDTFDFYVNKLSGRRGTYVCYFPLTDCVEFGEYKDDIKTSLVDKRQGTRVSRFVQNFISGKNLFYAVFKNDNAFDLVVIEANDEIKKMFELYASKPSDDEDAVETEIEVSVDDSCSSENG